MRRKILVLFIAAFASVVGAAACGVGGVAGPKEAPGDEPPSKVQEEEEREGTGGEPGWPLKPEHEPHGHQEEEIEEGEAP